MSSFRNRRSNTLNSSQIMRDLDADMARDDQSATEAHALKTNSRYGRKKSIVRAFFELYVFFQFVQRIQQQSTSTMLGGSGLRR
jgi:hypothetical protein